MDMLSDKRYAKNKYAEHKLICMLRNHRRFMEVSEVCSLYQNTYGHELPYKELGYVCPEDYLKRLSELTCSWSNQRGKYFVYLKPQVIQNQQQTRSAAPCRGGRNSRGSGLIQENTSVLVKYNALDSIGRHLVYLVKKNTDGLTIPKLFMLYKNKIGEELNLIDHGYNTIYDFIDTLDELVILNKSGTPNVFWLQKKTSSKHCIDQEQVTECVDWASCSFDDDASAIVSDNCSTESNSVAEVESRINDTIKNVFKTILKSHPKGVWASEFLQKFRDLVGFDFEMQRFGYYNFITLVEDLKSVFAVKEKLFSNGDFLLFDAEISEKEKPCQKSTVVGGDDYDNLNSEQKLNIIISNIRRLLTFNEEGVYLDEFFSVYKLNFGRVFDLEEFGCLALRPFLEGIAEEVPLCLIATAKRTKAYGYISKFPGNFGNSINFPVPSDIVAGDAKFKPQWIPDDVNLIDFTYVYFSTILNPSKLFIQFDDGSIVGTLDRLMDDIQKFYNSGEGELYKMHNVHLKKGMICVGKYSMDENWHRVEIQEVFNESVKVYFVDYGNSENISKIDLRYLRKDFYDTPTQAMQARLANIKPHAGVDWEPCVYDMMMENLSDKRLKTWIFGYTMPEKILFLYIWDPSDEETCSINDDLVNKGFAAYHDTAEWTNMTLNPHNGPKYFKNCLETQANYKISLPEAIGLSSLFNKLALDTSSKDDRGYASNANLGEEKSNQDGSMLYMLLNALNQSAANKTDAAFPNQLDVLNLLQQNASPQHQPDVSNPFECAAATNNILQSLSSISQQSEASGCLSSGSSSELLHTTNPHERSSYSVRTSTSGFGSMSSRNTPSCHELTNFSSLYAASPDSVFEPHVLKHCDYASSIESFMNFSLDEQTDDEYIPPPQIVNGNYISPPRLCGSSPTDSSGYCASAFSTSRSFSITSSSSDEKGAFTKNLLPSSRNHRSPHPNSSTLEENEPDVCNEVPESPVVSLCEEVIFKLKKSVKRLHLINSVTVHLIKLLNKPYIPCQDVACLALGIRDVDLMYKMLRDQFSSLTPVKIRKTSNEALFEEIERWKVKGIVLETIRGQVTPVLPVYPLRLALQCVEALNKNWVMVTESLQCELLKPDGN